MEMIYHLWLCVLYKKEDSGSVAGYNLPWSGCAKLEVLVCVGTPWKGGRCSGKVLHTESYPWKKANQLVGLLSCKRKQYILKLPMHVLPFFLLALHILVMMCMNYSCTCRCELKYHSSPKFRSLVETSKGFKPFVFVAVLLVGAFWQQCLG